MSHPIVKVEWIDSGTHVDHGWASAEKYMDDATPSLVTTIGTLMDENEEVVAVALSHIDQKLWYSAELIARSNIVSFTLLSEV